MRPSFLIFIYLLFFFYCWIGFVWYSCTLFKKSFWKFSWIEEKKNIGKSCADVDLNKYNLWNHLFNIPIYLPLILIGHTRRQIHPDGELWDWSSVYTRDDECLLLVWASNLFLVFFTTCTVSSNEFFPVIVNIILSCDFFTTSKWDDIFYVIMQQAQSPE